jgi:hypothetical protein
VLQITLFLNGVDHVISPAKNRTFQKSSASVSDNGAVGKNPADARKIKLIGTGKE